MSGALSLAALAALAALWGRVAWEHLRAGRASRQVCRQRHSPGATGDATRQGSMRIVAAPPARLTLQHGVRRASHDPLGGLATWSTHHRHAPSCYACAET